MSSSGGGGGTSAAAASAVTPPRWSRNIIRVMITAMATAYFLLSEDSQLPSLSWSGLGRGGGLGSSLSSVGSRGGGGGGKGGAGGRGTSGAPVWDDSMLYTKEGMSHDSWRLLPPGQLAPLTEETQSYLMQHQFPESCEGRRFLISHGNDAGAGMGSHLHIAGMHLGMAIELDRIFVWSGDVGMGYTDPETCDSHTNLECFFRSPSSCTIQDALAPGADTVEARFGLAGDDYKLKFWFTPRVFREMWARNGAPLGVHEMKYWWRGQSVAFLARFRDEAIERMRKLRLEAGKVAYWPAKSEWSERTSKEFPFRRGTVSLHVRHGDKEIEMKLVTDNKYFDAAEAMVVNSPAGHVRSAFISTEDPKVVESAKLRAVNDTRWSWLWYDVPRLNSNGLHQIQHLGLPKGQLTHIWWLQLLMALECDSWVGTRGSNWNRLIDELRCIWVPKCQHEYVEVGDWEDYHGYSW